MKEILTTLMAGFLAASAVEIPLSSVVTVDSDSTWIESDRFWTFKLEISVRADESVVTVVLVVVVAVSAVVVDWGEQAINCQRNEGEIEVG